MRYLPSITHIRFSFTTWLAILSVLVAVWNVLRSKMLDEILDDERRFGYDKGLWLAIFLYGNDW